jgi:hypothetical protein
MEQVLRDPLRSEHQILANHDGMAKCVVQARSRTVGPAFIASPAPPELPVFKSQTAFLSYRMGQDRVLQALFAECLGANEFEQASEF